MLPNDDWVPPKKFDRKGPVRTLREVGQIMFLRGSFDHMPTNNEVRQIEQRALAKLSRHPGLLEVLRRD